MIIQSLCQPDGLKGCSVCCGLFNLRDITKQNLVKFLQSSYELSIINSVRDITSHICPFQKFLSKNRPGCSLHPSFCGIDKRHLSLFGTKICNEYFCPAHIILTTEQKKILISMVSDWYLYSIAILDPEGFVFILDMINAHNAQISAIEKKFIINRALEYHANNLAQIEIPLFNYSVADYNQNKKKFSLPYNPDAHIALTNLIKRKFL